MLVRTIVARALSDLGVQTVFGLLGGGNMYILHEFKNLFNGTYIAAAREDGAVLMASAYAQVSGEVGVASVTYGPGLTNAVTALAEAVKAQVPMVVLMGHPAAAAEYEPIQNLQSIDHAAIVTAAGAGYQRVTAASTAIRDTVSAFRRALAERRPVVLSIPSDIQKQTAEYRPPGRIELRSGTVEPAPESLDEAVGIIASVARPLILAGRGAVAAGARDNLVSLAEKLGAPVATTLLAREFFKGENRNIGLVGTVSTPPAAPIIAAADCIVAFGASLNQWTAAGGALFEGKRLVQCDADGARLGQYFNIDAGIVGDAAVTASRIADMLEEIGHRPRKFFTQDMAAELATHSPDSEFEDQSTDVYVDPRTFLLQVDRTLPEERTLVVDGGRFTEDVLRFLRVPEPEAFVFPLSFGALGTGLASAVGASFARMDRPTVLAIGDGGLMASLPELATAVQHSLDLVIFVMNDGAYGQEYKRFVREGMDPKMSFLSYPDFAPVAEAFGASATTVRNLSDLAGLRERLVRRTGPLLVDVKINPLGEG